MIGQRESFAWKTNWNWVPCGQSLTYSHLSFVKEQKTVDPVTHSARSGEVYTLSSTLSHVTAEEPHAHTLQVLWGDLQNINYSPLSILALSCAIIWFFGIVGVIWGLVCWDVRLPSFHGLWPPVNPPALRWRQ